MSNEIKKYNIVLADPCWFYQDRLSGRVKGASSHYTLMETKDICALPVNNLTTDNSLLFMWVTAPCIPDGLEVMKAWGFKYLTVAFTWMKLNRSGWGLFYGIGGYTSSNCEFCFLGRKGKRIVPRKKLVSSAVLEPVMEHSRKPDAIHQRIDLMYPDKEITKLEMFARRPYSKQWDVFGNQVENTIDINQYYITPENKERFDNYVDLSKLIIKPKVKMHNLIKIMEEPEYQIGNYGLVI